jgi:hypothetical protein
MKGCSVSISNSDQLGGVWNVRFDAYKNTWGPWFFWSLFLSLLFHFSPFTLHHSLFFAIAYWYLYWYHFYTLYIKLNLSTQMTSTYQVYNPFFFKPYTGYQHPQHTYTSEPASSTIIMQNPGSVALDDGSLQSTCSPPPPYPSTCHCDHSTYVAPYPTGTKHEMKGTRAYKNQIHSHYSFDVF